MKATIPSERLPGWEVRLRAVLDSVQGRTYRLGRDDCFRLACEAIEALTGAVLGREYACSYTTRREALRLISAHGASFAAAATAYFGIEPVRPAMARRGDLLEWIDGDGEHHLVIGIGAEAVGWGPQGLVPIPLLDCERCWRIG